MSDNFISVNTVKSSCSNVHIEFFKNSISKYNNTYQGKGNEIQEAALVLRLLCVSVVVRLRLWWL